LKQAQDRDRWSRDPESKYFFDRQVAKIREREKRGLVDSGAGNSDTF